MPIDFYINDLNLTSRTTMWRWTRQGLRTTRVGGRVYVSQGDMQDFMANQDEGGEK